MKEIQIETSALVEALRRRGRRLGGYARHLVEDGHVAGALSGAELVGKARRWYAAGYSARRRAVEAATADVTGGNVGARYVGPRRKRVWATPDGEPVQIRLV